MNTDEHRCSPAATESDFHRWVVPGSARILRAQLVSAEIVNTLEACAPRKTRIKNLPVSSTELFFICVHLCSSVVSFFSHEPMRTAFAQNHRSSLGSLGKGLFQVALACVLIAVSGAAADRSLENGRSVIRNLLPNEYQAHESNMVAV